ncbi:MAG: hypothetical protein K0R49_852 [Burkholderiales bacterium]|jgi:hypothetical protein|nr:hypothetical protein [Burkholderiales bacterium]
MKRVFNGLFNPEKSYKVISNNKLNYFLTLFIALGLCTNTVKASEVVMSCKLYTSDSAYNKVKNILTTYNGFRISTTKDEFTFSYNENNNTAIFFTFNKLQGTYSRTDNDSSVLGRVAFQIPYSRASRLKTLGKSDVSLVDTWIFRKMPEPSAWSLEILRSQDVKEYKDNLAAILKCKPISSPDVTTRVVLPENDPLPAMEVDSSNVNKPKPEKKDQ